jgi:hypothetical protein
MLELIKDEQGNIKACLEWYLVNDKGEFDQQGEFVWVNEVEISPQYRRNGILKEFARIIIKKAPTAKFGYFWRQEKYPNRDMRIYHKVRWLKLLKERKYEKTTVGSSV